MKNPSLEYTGFIPHFEFETTEIRMHHSHVHDEIIVDIEVQDGCNSPNSKITLSAVEILQLKSLVESFHHALLKMQVKEYGHD